MRCRRPSSRFGRRINRSRAIERSGRDDIIANFARALDHQHDQRRHFITNIVFDTLTRSEATAIAYEVVTIANRGLGVGATVVCTTSLRKAPGKGLRQFSRMFIGMDDYI